MGAGSLRTTRRGVPRASSWAYSGKAAHLARVGVGVRVGVKIKVRVRDRVRVRVRAGVRERVEVRVRVQGRPHRSSSRARRMGSGCVAPASCCRCTWVG